MIAQEHVANARSEASVAHTGFGKRSPPYLTHLHIFDESQPFELHCWKLASNNELSVSL